MLLTPTLRSTVADPNGGNVRGIFEVYQGSTLKWTGTSAYVASGSSASVTVPSGILANGAAYSVRVRASDGSLSSKGYSASTAFTADTSKPTAAITASAFTNGQWREDTPSSNVFTLTGTSDTASFAYTLDGVSKPRLAAGSSGSASLTWLPGKGSHRLTVTPTDKAGNVGSTATFAFGYGGARHSLHPAVPLARPRRSRFRRLVLRVPPRRPFRGGTRGRAYGTPLRD